MTVSNVAMLAAPATAASQSTLNPAGKKGGQDFNALLQALGGTDNAGAPNALANLLQQLLSQSGTTQVHHHHQHAGNAQAAGGAGPLNSSTPGAASVGRSLHMTV